MMPAAAGTDVRLLEDDELTRLQDVSFAYFWHEANHANGLIADRTEPCQVCSTAAVGLALTAYPVAVERGLIEREAAIERTLTTLRFFANSPQGSAANTTGYQGLYYHFLDMDSGRRAHDCELSTIDSALLFAGMLTAAAYYHHETAPEAEIRELATVLYRRANWQWALNGGATISHGWKPESGFLEYRWQGYCEALLLYALALGSTTFPIPSESYQAWASTYQWRRAYEHEYLYAGPLFIHQLSHVWIDFRGIQDEYMRAHDLDYFENSRRATYVQQAYAMRNPKQFRDYGRWSWGLTASDGPGETTEVVNGVERTFLGYAARGVPDGPDDGTLAPWAVAASLPFAPEIVLPTLAHFVDLDLTAANPYGFKATYNPTFPFGRQRPHGWVSPTHYGLNQGPIALMIENFRTGLIWRLLRTCEPVVGGLRRAGFRGGWL
jgi:hypothetical protein